MGFGVRYGRVRLGATATLWPTASTVGANGIGVSMEAWHAGLEGCVALAHHRVWLLDVCLSNQGGQILADGIGWPQTQSQRPMFLVTGADFVIRAGRLGPLRAGLAAGALVPLGRYHFYGAEGTKQLDLDTVSPVIPTLRLDLGLVSD
jgi:hypothetical protein